jgi:hypothetical protein
MEFRNRNDILRPARLIHIQAHIQLALCRWSTVRAKAPYWAFFLGSCVRSNQPDVTVSLPSLVPPRNLKEAPLPPKAGLPVCLSEMQS